MEIICGKSWRVGERDVSRRNAFAAAPFVGVAFSIRRAHCTRNYFLPRIKRSANVIFTYKLRTFLRTRTVVPEASLFEHSAGRGPRNSALRVAFSVPREKLPATSIGERIPPHARMGLAIRSGVISGGNLRRIFQCATAKFTHFTSLSAVHL